MTKQFHFLRILSVALLVGCSWSQTSGKKIVTSEDDLPRFTYPVKGSASSLLQADDASFNAFAAKVRTDLDGILVDYEISDKATMRMLLRTELELQMLSGEYAVALETNDQLRGEQEKPSAKLTTGIVERAWLQAAIETKSTSGPSFDGSFSKRMAEAVNALPWDVVQDDIKQLYGGTKVVSPTFVIAGTKTDLDPAAQKSGALDNHQAWQLVDGRVGMCCFIPIQTALAEVLKKYIAAHTVEKPDIWAAREVTLGAGDKTTPVLVAIWDSGIDVSLFPDQLFTDPHPTVSGVHGLAFDEKGNPGTTSLYPLTPEQQKAYPDFRVELKGFLDTENGIDSPEADALQKLIRTFSVEQLQGRMEFAKLISYYIHGTHCAGIAVRGNPAARLVLMRFFDNYEDLPFPPTEEWARRIAADFQQISEYFKTRHVRVVNMSWGDDVPEFERWLSNQGGGADPAERKKRAEALYAIFREAIESAIKNAPDTLFVAAAGNSDSNAGFGGVVPALLHLPNLITVGAVNQAGDETSFTSYGDTVVVHADGYNVESYVPGGAKMKLSGTSMAAPNVVNLAAKMFALDPQLIPAEAIDLIRRGTTTSEDGRRHLIDEKRSVELLKEQAAKSAGSPQSATSSSPPVAQVRPVEDDYFGTKVVDPYRYMENLKDEEVQAWIKGQNDYARAVLSRIPGRARMLERLKEFEQTAPADVSDVRRLPGDLFFYQKRVSGEDLAKLYMRRGLSGEEKMVLDPEKIKLATSNQDKGKPSIQYYVPSPDGKFVIVGVAPGGSEDDTELHVIETATGRETGDVILRAPQADIAQPAWLPDSRSFTHGKLEPTPPGAPVNQRYDRYRAFLHVLGTDPDKDLPVIGHGVLPPQDVPIHGESYVMIPPGSHYAVGVVDAGIHGNNAYYIADASAIGKPNLGWRKIADFADDIHDIGIHGEDLYLLSFHGAPRYKILRIDARKQDLSGAETIVSPGEAVVVGFFTAQDALYVQILDGGIGRLLRIPYGPKPEIQRIDLPYGGRIWGAVPSVHAHEYNDPRVPGLLFTMTGWTKAPKVYMYDSQTKKVVDTKLQPSGPYDDPDNLESVEVKVRSYDGVMVPLSIVYSKESKRDGSHPMHLVGYGAYGNVESPYFWPGLLAFYEHGGIFATCHVRGGGEYGEEWHLAGKGPTKPNSWRDFIACAQYLVDQKYTSPMHISAYGGSAGGILIGRAITERPDLFGAAIIISGAVNALRMEITANGPSNFEEFGSTQTQEGFKVLYGMDALQHVKEHTAYPAILLAIGMNDPRTDPWYSAKLAARLQTATTSGKPILLRVEYEGGHFGDPSYNAGLEQAADEISFDLWQLGVPEFQPQ